MFSVARPVIIEWERLTGQTQVIHVLRNTVEEQRAGAFRPRDLPDVEARKQLLEEISIPRRSLPSRLATASGVLVRVHRLDVGT